MGPACWEWCRGKGDNEMTVLEIIEELLKLAPNGLVLTEEILALIKALEGSNVSNAVLQAVAAIAKKG
jgi:hypothetical protein